MSGTVFEMFKFKLRSFECQGVKCEWYEHQTIYREREQFIISLNDDKYTGKGLAWT